MPATVDTAPSVSNPVLSVVAGSTMWSGTIDINFAAGSTELARLDTYSPTELTNFGELDTDGQALITAALDKYKKYIAFDYTISNNTTSNYIAGTAKDLSQPTHLGWGSEPDPLGTTHTLNLNTDLFGRPEAAQEWAVLHEVGHLLGLTHFNSSSSLDFTQFSVMSYNFSSLDGGVGPTSQAVGMAATPMALDIAVLQAFYGAATAQAGDTTYVLGGDDGSGGVDLDGSDSTLGNASQYVCIWDSGGTDTIRYDSSNDVLINLNAATLASTVPSTLSATITALQSTAAWATLDGGTQSEISSASKNAGGSFSSLLASGDRAPAGFTIAHGATIERAIGGSGDDIIVGNEAANLLWGGAGGDALVDGQGADSLFGDVGDDEVRLVGDGSTDVVVGGGGSDTVFGAGDTDIIFGGEIGQVQTSPTSDATLNALVAAFVTASASYTPPDGYSAQTDDGTGDTISGEGGADQISGGLGNDAIAGGAGDDLLLGDLGNDTIDGGDDNDVLLGGSGNDNLTGGSGADTLNGGGGTDNVNGGDGSDLIIAAGDGDSLSGGDGDDEFRIGAGADTLDGGAGNDTVSAADFGSGISFTIGATSLGGHAIQNFEAYEGTAFADTLNGGSGNDQLNGGAGNDSLAGGDGDDSILGGDGNDTLDGGDGNDSLVGAAGDDSISASGDGIALNGGSGNDTLKGTGEAISFNGGAGDDSIDAVDTGWDATVFFGVGSGHDSLATYEVPMWEHPFSYAWSCVGYLDFGTLTPGDLEVHFSNVDIVNQTDLGSRIDYWIIADTTIVIKSTGESIYVGRTDADLENFDGVVDDNDIIWWGGVDTGIFDGEEDGDFLQTIADYGGM
ncbi:MAG TPA: M10 family metallopeptidase C-terminal domain-containing protein, partial [Caulobacteraceae bacterium]|nr:M10 family metallopeptidase C-terminal domain-containing protein [Caulobacteraceae bacterium]